MEFGYDITPQGISTVLKNDYYIGKVRYGDVEEEGNHFQLVSNSDFNKVKRILKRNRKR
jgi:hypothetical protein